MAIIYEDVGKGKEREQRRVVEAVYNNRQWNRGSENVSRETICFPALPFL